MVKLPLRRRVSAKCQVAIPVVLLRQYHIKPQEEVIFEAGKEGIVIKAANDPIERAHGFLKGLGKTSLQLLKENRREELEYERRKFKRYGIA